MTPEQRELRARRLAAARATHPDLGGDADEFVRVMHAFDSRAARARSATTVVVVSSPVRRAGRRLRAVGRTAAPRTRIPASWPGARRYTTL